jgi:para-nitrobenzyl esterase
MRARHPVKFLRETAWLGLLLLAVGSFAHAAEPPSVTLAGGALRGSESDGVRAFLGVPYAAQPVGELRWRAPQPAPAWSGVREATQFGAACPQAEDKLYGLTPKKRDEACLFLNVWSPAAHQQALPVLVWLHGGAHRIGAGSLAVYDGSRLAARGAVVVTLNYRLGYLGYFAHPALAAEDKAGNFGLMDEIQALKWVRDNIAAFGGDPSKVTVFGQSAGGADVLYLLTSAAGKGLFRSAIVESGGGWNKLLSREQMAKTVTENLVDAGAPKDADAAALRKLDVGVVLKAQAGDRSLGFGPFRDETVTFEEPWRVFAAGRAARVPLIIGSNDWEANLLKFREPGFKEELLSRLPGASDWYEGQAKTAAERQPLMFRDIVFGAPARWIAQHQSRQAPVWLYHFDHVSAGKRGSVPGAGHAAEIAYVFDNLARLGTQVDDADMRLAKQLADCWIAFAASGEPRCEGIAWKAYDAARDNLLLIGDAPHEVEHHQAAALDGIDRWFAPGSWLGPR